MDMLKKIFPLSFQHKADVAALVINVLIQLVVSAVAGWIVGIVAAIPLIGFIFGLVGSLLGLYFMAGTPRLLSAATSESSANMVLTYDVDNDGDTDSHDAYIIYQAAVNGAAMDASFRYDVDTDEAVAAGFNAGAIIKEIAPLVQGGGGGKPTMAQAGGKNPAGIDDAIAKAAEVLKGQIK